MRRLILTLSAMLMMVTGMTAARRLQIEDVNPLYWWVGMANDTLQVMLRGDGIRDAAVKADYPGVRLVDDVRTDSPNYRILYFVISPDTRPGTMDITLDLKGRKATVPYELRARDGKPGAAGFDSSDVLYLIMPDRFADGDTTNNEVASLVNRAPVDRSSNHARHGGDIKGMRDHLDYVDSLGVTAIWVNPVLENDMPGGSYHGYATTDYYRIDPRFGSNEEWNEFVAACHDRGIKVVMDMIFNHSGSGHPWFGDRPFNDWFNFADGYVQTNYRLSTLHDPYVSDYDKRRTVDGWFVEAMPDLNQRNPHLMKYLIQNSIWWIESSKIDGIRMDTHPYADFDGMARWIAEVMRQYPGYNIVGECWYGSEGGEAFWQKDSYVNRKGNSNLPTVMDFVLSIKGRDAFSGQTDRLSGLNDIYDHLALDYLFPNPQNILTFLDNHDTDRFLLSEPNSLGWWKQAMAFLLTSRGIPQIYYGTEILMNGSRADGGDGNVRRDIPGGFPGDSISVFTSAGRSPKQEEAHAFLTRLLNWRKGNDVIARGSLKHFMPEQGVYTYERRLGDNSVVVMMNGNDAPVNISMAPTAEVLPVGSRWHDMLSDTILEITPEMEFGPRALYILDHREDDVTK
ncbi:MAG: glycoside hydrolase family 13 protein [Pseudoflavonifractor sp.]|nr:glycoside hydrolase family 13 protein [Pseudoflavonifractor sp.]